MKRAGGSKTGEDIVGWAPGATPRHDVVVVGVQTGFASEDGDAWLSIAAGQVRRKIKVEEFGYNGMAIGGAERRFQSQDPGRARPVEYEFGFGARGNGKAGGAMKDGGRVDADPNPVTNLPERKTSQGGR